MWFLLFLLPSFAHCEAVNFQDHFRVLLQSKTNPCEGHVEVYYNNELGYVGDKYWDKHTEEVVCRSTHCGKPVVNSTGNVRRSMKHKVWLNELKCEGNEMNLWDCPGWPGPSVSFYQKSTVKRIKCTDDVKISLKQHKCEGAVQFSRNGKLGYICTENFREKDATRLCEILGCGECDKMLKAEWMIEEDFQHSDKMMLNCAGIANVTNLWQCVRPASSISCKHPASISCAGHNKLQLKGNSSNVCSGQLEHLKNNTWQTFKVNKSDRDKWCKQMHCGGSPDLNQTAENLTCSDSVKVVLMDNKKETKCFGEVNINVNGIKSPVCASGWGEKEAEMVCKELNCGKLISNKTKPSPKAEYGIMNHVKCEGDEASLWYCRAKHGKKECSSIPYVVCAESMDVKLVDSPGKCSGRLEVLREGRWEQVSRSGWTEKDSDNVCKQLKCGDKIRKNNKDKFRNSTGNILSMTCNKDMSHISECTIKPNPPNTKEDVVGITCDEHKVVFLDGPEPCSGRVGIEQGDRIHWLSGSDETWNQDAANTVCQQLHCGNAKNFTSEPYNDTTPVWNEVYSSSNNDSLFEYNKTTAPSDSNLTVANVMCTGKIKVSLTNSCWGYVNISVEGKSGGIYADTWTEDMSKELCKELRCGDAIKPITSQTEGSNVIFKSLHARNQITPLNKYIFVMEDNGFKGKSENKAYVVCKDSVKPRFSMTRDKCSGNIEMLYEGKWLPVSKSSLENSQTQNTICNKLKCGDALSFSTYFGPRPAVDHAIKIKCSGKKFSSCAITNEKLTTEIYKFGALQCSGLRKMALEVDYACKGEVNIYSKVNSEDVRSVVSSQSWTWEEGERLCKDLNCGKFKSNKTIPLDASEIVSVWNKTFKCSTNAKSIWDCETDVAPSELNKLYIECEGEPKVRLSRECAGEVIINDHGVCDSEWQLEYSHRICQQLNCGNAINGLMESPSASPRKIYQHVLCDEHNYIIGQCYRVKGACRKLVTISCTGSVSFNISGNCNGHIVINYRNKNEKLCKANVSEELLGNMCEDNDCGGLKTQRTVSNRKGNTEVSLHCPSTYKNMRYCVAKETTCETQSQLHIECAKSVQPTSPPPPSKPINPVLILVGVGIVLILVVLIVIFIRYRIVMRNRKARLSSNRLPEQEGEWESGDYEDVDKSDEIEDFSHGRFRSESEIKREKDVDSNASFSYDDIDEVAETQPLTSPGSTDAVPKNKVPNPNGVTYEVDDSQENYDDIDASSEAAQTRAEVHDGSQTTQETDAAAPQESVQKDEDYLVPGQDG